MQYCASQRKLQKAGHGTKTIYCLIEVGGGKGVGIQFHTGIKPSPLPLCIYFMLGLKKKKRHGGGEKEGGERTRDQE